MSQNGQVGDTIVLHAESGPCYIAVVPLCSGKVEYVWRREDEVTQSTYFLNISVCRLGSLLAESITLSVVFRLPFNQY